MAQKSMELPTLHYTHGPGPILGSREIKRPKATETAKKDNKVETLTPLPLRVGSMPSIDLIRGIKSTGQYKKQVEKVSNRMLLKTEQRY